MAVLSTLLEAGALLALTWWLLARHRDPRTPSLTVAVVFLSWALGLMGLLLLPMDVARHTDTSSPSPPSLVDTQRRDDANDNGEADKAAETRALLHAWQLLYWASFVLSWLVLPLLMELARNGEFTLQQRVTSSIQRLVLHWTMVAAGAGAIALYLLVVGHLSVRGVLGLAMAAGNTYGLVWLIALLGYGLVAVPRSLWQLRQPRDRLSALHFQATALHDERVEADMTREDVEREVARCWTRVLQSESASIILTGDMQRVKSELMVVRKLLCLDVACASAYGERRGNGSSAAAAGGPAKRAAGSSTSLSCSSSSSSSRRFTSPLWAMTLESEADNHHLGMNRTRGGGVVPPPTHDEVVALHRRAKLALSEQACTRQAWHALCLHAEWLDALVHGGGGRATMTTTTDMITAGRSTNSRGNGEHGGDRVPSMQQYTQRVALPMLSTGAAVITGVGSLSILCGEMTMSWGHALADWAWWWVSLFNWTWAWVSGDDGDDAMATATSRASATELLVLALLTYMAACAYMALKQLQSFGRYALRGHGHSDELALLTTALQQCRLQFALGDNLLLLVQTIPRLTVPSSSSSTALDGSRTAFHQLGRDMRHVHVLGRDFAAYAPLVLGLLVACTLGNVYTRVLTRVTGMGQYEQYAVGSEAQDEVVRMRLDRGEALVRASLTKERGLRARARKAEDTWQGYGYGYGCVGPRMVEASSSMTQALLSDEERDA